MNQEHEPYHLSTFSKGANSDDEKEFIGAQPASGVYVDMNNGRPVSDEGNTGSAEKIKGEISKYPNPGIANYECVGSIVINKKLVEFWADKNNTAEGIIRVDGVIVLKSIDFELRTTHPLQLDKNENCIGGEVFVTDFRVPPYIFNIQDMIDSLTTNPNKYFSAFEPLIYQINLQSPLDIPVFVELINVGGGGGLPVGQYQYSIRYTNDEGDRTQWSAMCPPIPVVQSLSSESRVFPWVKTRGGAPNPGFGTAYAPKLRFRCTNLYNYKYIEVRRTAYNAGAGIDFTPIGKIVAKIEITPGEVSVKEYVDPAESNVEIPLSAQDETTELAEIEAAKTIRYFDKRTVLMNVKLASKDSDLTFETINGKQGFPVIDKLYKAGYNDPYNHTYRRSFMRGERQGFGINLYDGVGTSGFVSQPEDLKDYQFPNRRDPIATETGNYSYGGTAKAADTTTNAVGQTHEVFDLNDPTYKTDVCSFKNIAQSGRITGLTGTKTVSTVTQECEEEDAEIENHGAHVTAGALVSSSYQPFTPVSQNDPDVTGHEYVSTVKAISQTGLDCVSIEANEYNFRPTGFAPDYYSMGMMIAGVDNFPKWAKAFSVVRTESARRVVCQGLGFYSMLPAKYKTIGTAELGGKEKNKFWFYAPDIENGIVSSDMVNDIIDNPQNYALQFVSPLGFFSETYSFESNLLANCRDKIVDMISYVRLLRDLETDANNQVNPNEDANMGIPGGDGYNYICHDKYRNTGQNPNTFGGHTDKGNRVINIDSVRRVAEGRGTYIELETQTDIYGTQSTGGTSDRNFDDGGLKDFTEPMYIINIIRTGAQISDSNVQKYKQTTHYQKLESIIGLGNGNADQKLILVDERWEDCIPSLTASTYGAATDRYIYIKHADGTEEKWINVTFKTTTQIALIVADIQVNGSYTGGVTGVYTHENIDGGNRFFNIIFNHPLFIPQEGDKIIVKYDKTAPIRVYGGDTYIGEAIFAPLDRKANAKDDAAETTFAWGVGLPFFKWKLNPRYYTIRKAGAALNVIQDAENLTLGYIRQLCAMFTVESRTAIHYAHNDAYPNQFFPLINYVIRPNRWDQDKDYKDNGIWDDYADDYGADEITQWKWGGFRFKQQINPDYSCEPPIKFFSRPKFGFTEKTEFYTRVMWSLPRAINVQDSPGLKTFPANNSFDIDDDQGEIKRAYDCTTSRGENLYAFTNNGVCMLITKKSILSDLNGGELGYMAADTFVKHQQWWSKEVGMFDEMWRGTAESYVPITAPDGSEILVEAIFWPSNESVYRMINNEIIDIARIGYHTRVFKNGVKLIGPGYNTHMTAAFDKKFKEYWLHIGGEFPKTFVFGQKTGMWHGTNDYRFDRFSVSNDITYGHRDFQTLELNQGYLINGSPVEFSLTIPVAPEQKKDKEFIRVRINASAKPTKVEFYKEVNGVKQCEITSLNLKDYRGWEQFIGRIEAAVDVNRPRLQGRLLIYKILHNLASDFKVIDSDLQYKPLK